MKNIFKKSMITRIEAVLLAAVLFLTSTGFDYLEEYEDFGGETSVEEAIEVEENLETLTEEVEDETLGEEQPEESLEMGEESEGFVEEDAEEETIEEESTEEVSEEEITEDLSEEEAIGEVDAETEEQTEKAEEDEILEEAESVEAEEVIEEDIAEDAEEVIDEEEETEEISEEAVENEISEEVVEEEVSEEIPEEEAFEEDAVEEEIVEEKVTEEVAVEEVEEDIPEEEQALEESATIDGVKITVSAEEGVFPAGSYIQVKKVSSVIEANALKAVDELRDDSKNVAASYTYDITVFDKFGKEIEPDNSKGSVKVSFAMVEVANENLDIDVYHVEEADDSFEATKLTDIEVVGDELTAGTDGFSLYTVEFTYNSLQYVLNGNETVDLMTILSAVGLEVNGSIDNVKSSNNGLFLPKYENGAWYISAVQAFGSVELLTVTIDGIDYEIIVTDDQNGGTTPGVYAPVSGADAGKQSNLANNPFTSGLFKSVNAVLANDTSKVVKDTKPKFNGTGESHAITIEFPGAYKYFDDTVYNVFVKIIPNIDDSKSTTAATWKADIEKGSKDAYYFIKLVPGGTLKDFDYEVWLEDSKGNTMSDLALVGGSCYTSNNEGARPWSDDGKIYSNIPLDLTWKTEKNAYYPDSSSYNEAQYYILGHGFAENGHIYGGFYCTSGEGEIVLGYLSRKLSIKIDNETIDIQASDGYPIGKNGADFINGKNSAVTGWTANQDVVLKSGETIPKDSRIPKDDLQYVIVEEGLILTAFKIPAYEVSFNLNYDGHPTNPDTVEIYKDDAYVTLPTPAARTGYTFDGWYTAATGGEKKEATDTVTGNHTLYAHWTALQYTLSFDLNYDSHPANPEPVTRNYGTVYSSMLPTDPERTGYNFLGWYNASNGGTKVESTKILKATETLYAHWQIKSYTVSFDGNGGTVPSGKETKNVNYGYAYGDLPVPTLTGYTFLGWYTDAQAGNRKTETDLVFAEHILYAHWQINQYTLAFDAKASDVTNPDSKTLDYNSAYGELPSPSRTGYDLVGWYTDETYATKANASDLITKDTTLFALWDAKSFKVTFVGNGGEVPSGEENKQVIYDETYGVLPIASYAGYTFGGWYTATEGGNEIKAETVVKITADQTLYAHWNPITYAVTFDPNEGFVSETSRNVVFGNVYGTLPVPTYIGHTFNGWYSEKINGTLVTENSSILVAADHTLFALWTDNNVTVSMEGYVYGAPILPVPDNTLTNEEKASNPTVKYFYSTTDSSTGGTEWTDMTTETLAPGTYYMYAEITGADGTTYITVTTSFTVAKATPTYTPPTANDLTYNGNSQELVTAGTAEGGEMLYSLTYDSNGEGYTNELPKGTDAGDYEVYYMVKGDINHKSLIIAVPVDVTIAKAQCTVVPPVDLGSIFNGEAQKLVSAATCSEGGHVEYSLDNISFSTDIPTGVEAKEYDVYYKVVPDANHIGVDAQSVKANIYKNLRPSITLSMDDYKYGQKDAIPVPSLDSEPEENPTVIFYYYPAGHPEEKKVWDGSITSKTLDAGEYCIYAEIGSTENYGPYTTEPVSFTVEKGDYSITAPSEDYVYGEKIGSKEPKGGKAVALDAEGTELSGIFTWTDEVKEIIPKVTDSIEKNGTLFEATFTPSEEFIRNYNPKNCDCKIRVAAKEAEPTELNMKLEKVDNGGEATYDVTENMIGEVDPVLVPGVDYDVTVVANPNKDKDGNIVDIDYVITYTFKGNYSGTISQKVNMPVPKTNPEGENDENSILARVDREQNVIDAYNPKMEAPDYEAAKNLVLQDFAKHSEESEACKTIYQKLMDNSQSQDVVFKANVVIEVTKPVEGQGDFKDDKPIAEAYISENIEDAGTNVEYIDISMFTTYKLFDSKDSSKVYETNKSRIRDTGDNEEIITIDIPDSMRTYPSDVERTYYIIRVHDKVAEELVAEFEDGRITFGTSKFSTYAIAYADKKKPAPAPDPAPGGDEPALLPTPQKKVVAPKTGNSSEITGWFSLLISGIAVLLFGRKKKINCEQKIR